MPDTLNFDALTLAELEERRAALALEHAIEVQPDPNRAPDPARAAELERELDRTELEIARRALAIERRILGVAEEGRRDELSVRKRKPARAPAPPRSSPPWARTA